MHPGAAGIISSQPLPARVNHLGNAAGNSVGASNWTFTTFNAGGNGLGSTTVRKTIMVIAYSKAASNNNIMTSCTIAGVAATSVSSLENVDLNTNIRVWTAAISATSGNITIITGGTTTDCCISVFEVLDANITIYDNQFIYDPGTQNFNKNIMTRGGGVLMAAAMTYYASGTPAFTWTNATKIYDTPAASACASFAYIKDTGYNPTLNIGMNMTGGTSAAGQAGFILASFQPLQ